MEDKCPTEVGTSVTVDIQIVALNLVSVEPITVTFSDGQESEEWDVQVCLSSFPQPMGTMTITLDEEDCGTLDSTIPVLPKFTFIRRSTGAEQFVDCGERGQICDALLLEGIGNDWVLIDGPGGFNPADHSLIGPKPGIQFDSNCDGEFDNETVGASSCFQAGMTCAGDGFECSFNEEAEGKLEQTSGAGQHESVLNSDDDADADGWPDECDNCPDTPSRDQTDSDDDGWGDICDNCPNDANEDQADADGDGVGDVCDNCPELFNPDQGEDDCPPLDLGDFSDAPGDYFFQTDPVFGCPDDDHRVSLVVMGDGLVLHGLQENGDILLTLNGMRATASDVVAFGIDGHIRTLDLFNGEIQMILFQPETNDTCFGNLLPLAQDCFESTGRATVTLDMADTECANGAPLDLASGLLDAIVELDPPPYTTDTDIQTEMVQLELSGDGGDLGPITIRLRGDMRSMGTIENVVAEENGDFVSGDSFFDLFLEIEIGDGGLLLNSQDTALRLDAGAIDELPPLGTDYLPPPSAPPVPLFDENGVQMGWLCHAEHTPTEVVPCE